MKNTKKRKTVKQEPCMGEENSVFDVVVQNGGSTSTVLPTELDERNLNLMDKMIEALDKQAAALSQMAQASLTNSKAMQQIAEASHKQALAVERLATTFEGMCGSIYEVRNAIIGMDYTMKRCCTQNNSNQNRDNANLFS
ncbi:unnamed protein product [Leptidea sinapis]|uniref:Uncharacterized protein n=1 Tax=Leptidea sinapis TaxID=189913 RepID=A0A5E4Q4Y6_9NEOP|nr:unnamed protein product [Leptidea sinapis]